MQDAERPGPPAAGGAKWRLPIEITPGTDRAPEQPVTPANVSSGTGTGSQGGTVVTRQRAALVMGAAFAVALASGSLGAQQGSQPQLPADKLEISAFAVNMSNIATGANEVVAITVNQWSTAEERERLITTMLTKGSKALLKELQKAPVKGRFRIPGKSRPDPHHLALGLDIRYAWQTPLPEGGRRLLLAMDRYIGMQEARNQPRSIDYPFTLIEIRVDRNGKGEGKMSIATKINFDKEKKVIELENYSSEPVRLNNVEVKVKS
jgi:hypothetical protein